MSRRSLVTGGGGFIGRHLVRLLVERGEQVRVLDIADVKGLPDGVEFIRRFLMHVLPKGFVRIRHFGFMANYQRTASLDLCRKLLAMAPVDHSTTTVSATSSRLCPRCGAAMVVVQRLTAAQIRWRFIPTCAPDTS